MRDHVDGRQAIERLAVDEFAGKDRRRRRFEYWKPWFEAAGVDLPEPTRGPIFNDSSYLMQAAAEGQGVALARSCLLANDLKNGVLVRLFDIEVPAPRKHYLVYPPRMANSPKLALFRQWLHAEIESDRGGTAKRRERTAPRGKSR